MSPLSLRRIVEEVVRKELRIALAEFAQIGNVTNSESASGQEKARCQDKEKNMQSDLISTATNGALSSLEQRAIERLNRLRAKAKQSPRGTRTTRKLAAGH